MWQQHHENKDGKWDRNQETVLTLTHTTHKTLVGAYLAGERWQGGEGTESGQSLCFIFETVIKHLATKATSGRKGLFPATTAGKGLFPVHHGREDKATGT